MSDKLQRLESRKRCNEKLDKIKEVMNNDDSLKYMGPVQWELFLDHLDEDLTFLERLNDYHKNLERC